MASTVRAGGQAVREIKDAMLVNAERIDSIYASRLDASFKGGFPLHVASLTSS